MQRLVSLNLPQMHKYLQTNNKNLSTRSIRYSIDLLPLRIFCFAALTLEYLNKFINNNKFIIRNLIMTLYGNKKNLVAKFKLLKF